MNQGRRVTTAPHLLQATCNCGTAQHGILTIDISAWDERSHAVDLQFYTQQMGYSLKDRLIQAWRVLRGQHVETDFEMSIDDLRRMGQWCVERADQWEKTKTL